MNHQVFNVFVIMVLFALVRRVIRSDDKGVGRGQSYFVAFMVMGLYLLLSFAVVYGIVWLGSSLGPDLLVRLMQ